MSNIQIRKSGGQEMAPAIAREWDPFRMMRDLLRWDPFPEMAPVWSGEERSHGSFTRAFTLPDGIDAEHVRGPQGGRAVAHPAEAPRDEAEEDRHQSVIRQSEVVNVATDAEERVMEWKRGRDDPDGTGSAGMRCVSPVTLVLALGLACASSASSSRPVEAKSVPTAAPARPALPEMREAEWLPEKAREILTARMQRHGDDMMFLMASIVLLSYDGTERLAEQIASEPRIGRPAPGEEDTLNALLPARFFELQDEMRVRAKAVSAAAKAKDNVRMLRTHGQLVETCVKCHSVYLKDEFEFGPLNEAHPE